MWDYFESHKTTFGLVVFAVVFVIMRFVRNVAYLRAEETLHQWARDNGYKLLSIHYQWNSTGPFFWSAVFLGCIDQFVFRVKVADKEGWIMQGWVCCRGIASAATGRPVEVEWDKVVPE